MIRQQFSYHCAMRLHEWNAMLGDQIARLRKLLGMSQMELAAILHASVVGMHEQGRRTLELGILIRLANVFEATLDHLILRKDPKKRKLPMIKSWLYPLGINFLGRNAKRDKMVATLGNGVSSKSKKPAGNRQKRRNEEGRF